MDQPAEVHPNHSAIDAVSCSSSTFCLAVDATGGVLQWNGRGWSSPRSLVAASLTSVSCPSAGFCMAVTSDGVGLAYRQGVWSAGESFAAHGLKDVSCVSPTFCVAVDDSGRAYRYSASGWSGGALIDSQHALVSVSCPTSTFCLAVDNLQSSFRYDTGSWTPLFATGSTITSDVSCVSATFCVSGNRQYDGKTWLDSHVSAEVTSCVSTAFCAGLDVYIYDSSATTFSSTARLEEQQVGNQHASTGFYGYGPFVTCLSVSVCQLVDTKDYVRYDGSGWQGPAGSIVDAYEFDPEQQSVACWSAVDCRSAYVYQQDLGDGLSQDAPGEVDYTKGFFGHGPTSTPSPWMDASCVRGRHGA